MERRLKERLTGAAVLVMIAVIFIPMILDNSNGSNTKINQTNIPPKPESNFRSRIIPVDDTRELTPLNQPDMPEDLVIAESVSETELTPTPATTRPAAESPAVVEPQAQILAPQVSSIESDNPQSTRVAATVEPRGLTAWVVQLGSFSNQDNAEGLVRRLQSGGYPAYIEKLAGESGPIFRVRVGPELSKTDAESTLKNLDEKFSVKGILLQYP